jgi:hypothetical protein
MGKFYLLCCALVCTVSVQAQSKPIESKQAALRSYQFLKTRVMAHDLDINWGEFRVAAAVAEVDGGFNWHPVRERVLAAVDQGKLPAALAGAQTVIDHNMAEPEGHLLAMMVYQQMGRDDDAARERAIVDAIVKSIMGSGDGMSEQKAWVTVSPGEVEFVVSIVLDAEAKSHVVVRTNGHDYDKLTVAGEDGAEHVLWFNTDTDAQIASAEMLSASKQTGTLSASSKR